MLLVGKESFQSPAKARAAQDLTTAPARAEPLKMIAAQSVQRAAAPDFVPGARWVERIGDKSTHDIAVEMEMEMELEPFFSAGAELPPQQGSMTFNAQSLAGALANAQRSAALTADAQEIWGKQEPP